MPIPKLNITNEIAGLPRQPVPLRYAVLVAAMGVRWLMFVLAQAFNGGHRTPYSTLNAYEYSEDGTRHCRPDHFRDMLHQIENISDEKERMKLLPVNWFVYSDELADTFSKLVELAIGREEAVDHRINLSWNPAVFPYETEIEACSIIQVPASELSKREKGKQATAQKHQAWYNEYSEIKKSNPTYTDPRIAKSIAKKYNTTEGTVRRVITNKKAKS